MTDTSASPSSSPASPAPSPAPAPAQNAAPSAAQTQEFNWDSLGLSPEHLAYVRAKKYANPASVIAARIAAEKIIGSPPESYVKLPSDDKPESWAPVYERLGRPKTVDEYKLPVPQGDDGTFAKTAGAWMHEAGLSTRQAQLIAQRWNEFIAKSNAESQRKEREEAALQQQALRERWGPAFDTRYRVAVEAAKAFGMDEKQLRAVQQAMGYDGGLEFLYALGSRLGREPGYAAGERTPAFGAMTPEEARARIKAVKSDTEWMKKYLAGDAETRQQWTRWHQIGYPGSKVDMSAP